MADKNRTALKYTADLDEQHERRAGEDRRQKPTNPFSLMAHRGRRKTIRRDSDRKRNPYTDQYSRRLLLTALLLILLCVADALFTIFYVSGGKAVEINYLMNVLLENGPFLFFGVKFFLSASCIIILVLYRHHPMARRLMSFALIIYSALFFYHIFSFFYLTGLPP